MTDDKDRTDAATVTWTTARGTRHRIVFEPRSDGDTDRITEIWHNGRWRESGREVISHVDIDAPEDSSFLSLFPRSGADE